jgi:hypothetical protein
VPFVPQSEELCGGAAAAMVMRYWGATGVYAESFADLVDRDAGGIRAEELIGSLRERGWQVVSLAGAVHTVRDSLNRRRPVIVMIEDRPGRLHYVVVVGWHAGRIVLHDPARAPFRILGEKAFVQAWSKSAYWTLVVLPGPRDLTREGLAPPLADVASESATAATDHCGAMVDEGIRLANAGAVEEARRLLELAGERCPGDAAVWRELAGIHALRRDWRQAAAHARRALEKDRDDEHAARILAAGLYLEGETVAALDAWNLVGEPVIDIVEIRGLERTRFAAAAGMLRLPPQTVLTASGFQRAARRLDLLPSAMGSRVSYVPRENGLAHIAAGVIERQLVPTGPPAVAAEVLRAFTEREVRVNIASPTGGGELWYGAWRWWKPRSSASVGLSAPAPFGGVWGVEAADEGETFGSATDEFHLTRRRVGLRAADWATRALRWETSVDFERWATGISASLSGAVQHHLARDRVALTGRASVRSGAVGAWTAGASASVRSRVRNDRSAWLLRFGGTVASAGAPPMLWPGAGAGQGREELLRAHPLLDDGVIRDGVFGRRLLYASGEWRVWSGPVFRMLRIAPAAFVDAARAYMVPAYADARGHVDVGVGIRVALPGAGVLRADLARGSKDGRMAFTFCLLPSAF